MGGDETRFPDDALADIAYLGRSRNRVEILEHVVSRPYAPRELAAATDIARSTLERILAELADRGWAERTTDGTYVATASGYFVFDEFIPLVRTMEAIDTLGAQISWLPRDDLSISLSHFSDATVRHPEDPTETIDYLTETIRETDAFRVMANLRPPESNTNAIHDRVRSGQMTFEYVLTPDILEYLRSHQERAPRWVETIEAGANLWVTERTIPCNLWIFDETVWIKSSDPASQQDTYGVPIISNNDTVRSWAHELIDRFRRSADPVDAESFEGHSSSVSEGPDEVTPSGSSGVPDR